MRNVFGFSDSIIGLVMSAFPRLQLGIRPDSLNGACCLLSVVRGTCHDLCVEFLGYARRERFVGILDLWVGAFGKGLGHDSTFPTLLG